MYTFSENIKVKYPVIICTNGGTQDVSICVCELGKVLSANKKFPFSARKISPSDLSRVELAGVLWC